MRFFFLVFAVVFMLSNLAEGQQRRRARVPKVDPSAAPVDSSSAPPVANVSAPSPVQGAMDSIRRSDSLISAAGYDPLSLRKVHVSDVMYKMQVWRVLDLREKCNQPFLAKGNEITKAISDAVFAGKLVAYAKDSLTQMLSTQEFKDKLTDPSSAQQDAEGNPVPGTGVPFMPNQMYILKFRENLLFDKQRSRFYYDIQSITLFIPAEFNTIKGTEQEVASFRYADVAKVFKSMPNARWYNSQNRAEDKKISDAMDLRLFCSRILKISNPKDQMIQDMPEYRDSPRSVLVASQKYEYELVSKENDVWDY
jgi:gliding motility associated protien GldN